MLFNFVLATCCWLSLLGLVWSKPIAVVHIGPHKAASTYVQTVLTNEAERLANNNFYWPTDEHGSPLSEKGISGFANTLRGKNKKGHVDSSLKKLTSFFDKALQLNRSIILSAEAFDTVKSDGVKELQEMLIGFDVKLVYVYRENLSHMLSLYYQLNQIDAVPFSEYLIAAMDSGGGRTLQPHKTIATYAEHFGNDSLHIIDMIGCEASHTDIAYVVYCEVAGVMCTEDIAPMKPVNIGHGLIVAQVFSHYRAYVETQNDFKCRFCKSASTEYEDFNHQYKGDLTSTSNGVPQVTSKLSMLIPYAEHLDNHLRNAYGKYMLHGNQTANFNAMRNDVEMTQLDSTAFMKSPKWIRWLQKAYGQAKKQNRLCTCG